jgi:POT family proton-dependent oligopeptide transporter
MWERFSYYGMKALLILYLVNALHWSVVDAASLYGNYTALAYITPMLGGYIADRFFGPRVCLVAGGVIIATGHFLLTVHSNLAFYGGLMLVAGGVGLFKPNVSTMVGQLYGRDDKRRDAGFTIFYMGISVGSLIAPLTCGYLSQAFGWHYGFAAAGVGMVAGLVTFLWGQRRYLPSSIEVAPLPPRSTPATSARERKHLLAVLLTIAITVPFWACYEQFSSSLSLFTDRHIARTVGHFEVPTSWFQSVNPIYLLLFAPPLAYLWKKLRDRNEEPDEPWKILEHVS